MGVMRDRDPAGRARNARPHAQRLLDADRPFHAHEVLEAVWKAAPDSERELWRGLAQVAVGVTHVRRGNAKGAQALLRRAADRIAPFAPGPYGIDVAGVVRDVRAVADRIEADGIDAVTDAELSLRLIR